MRLAITASDVIIAAKKNTEAVIPQLHDAYANRFRNAVDAIFSENENIELASQLRSNITRFAAYKAHYVSTVLKKILNDNEIPVKDRDQQAKEALHTFKIHEDAEYTTAVARARTAKNFDSYFQPDNLRLFPNLKWLESRSVNKRVAHSVFYGRIWPKNDPFWESNTPGTEWNCKCALEETNDSATSNSNVKPVDPPRGLDGNPFFTGQIFTDKIGYVRSTSNSDKRTVSSVFVKNEKEYLLNKWSDKKEIIDAQNLVTKKFLHSKNTYDKLVKHAIKENQITALYYLKQDVSKLTFIRNSPLGENKDLKNPKDKRNIEKKKKRGVLSYNIYNLEILGENYTCFLEYHKDGFEQLYAVYKTK